MNLLSPDVTDSVIRINIAHPKSPRPAVLAHLAEARRIAFSGEITRGEISVDNSQKERPGFKSKKGRTYIGDLDNAISDTCEHRRDTLLIVVGYSKNEVTEAVARVFKTGVRRWAEIVACVPKVRSYSLPNCSLLVEPVHIVPQSKLAFAIRKSAIRLRVRARVVMRRITSHDEFEKYFSLRYSVWKDLGYLNPALEDIDPSWELDYTDRTSVAIGAFNYEDSLVGCARLVFEVGNEVPDQVQMVRRLLDSAQNEVLMTRFEYPKNLNHPFDILESFKGFRKYYKNLVMQEVSKAELSRIIVDENWRKYGVGESIVDTIVTVARSHPYRVKALFLACKQIHSSFYERSGFNAVDGLFCENFVGIEAPSIAMEMRQKQN